VRRSDLQRTHGRAKGHASGVCIGSMLTPPVVDYPISGE
jgi:hypothetical protein